MCHTARAAPFVKLMKKKRKNRRLETGPLVGIIWPSIFVIVLKIILIRVNTRGKRERERDGVLLPGLFRDCEILVFIHMIGPFFL